MISAGRDVRAREPASLTGAPAPANDAPEPLPVTRGRTLGAPLFAEADVVIIGSGAGGAVAAYELARDGRSVIVLEEGGYYAPAEYAAMAPSGTFRRMARESGMAVALGSGDTPLISLLSGKCVGGSSVLTGGVCFRIPDEVLHGWARDRGLVAMSPEHVEPFFADVERACHVETVPHELRSRATERFVEGAERLGITMRSMRRNTRGCRGAARCNFGCPNHAKMSVDVAYLPRAVGHGARIVADALVERIDVTGGKARGVRGRFLDGETGEPRVRFEIRAKVVIVACGALHTPVLLQKSGLTTRHVGRNLTLHPAIRIGALFDEPVDGWDGALQSVYSDDFLDRGIKLNGVYTAVNVLAAAFPGVGREHRRLVERIPHLAFFGAQIHDEGGGHVRSWFSREPMISYRMAKKDKASLLESIRILGRMALAGGAREVLLPVFGSRPITKESDLDFLDAATLGANRVECMSFHPLGSARMSASERDGVVKPTGETWAVQNLFVVDGSVLPTSVGVNSQLPIMGVATMLSRQIAEDFGVYARRAAYA